MSTRKLVFRHANLPVLIRVDQSTLCVEPIFMTRNLIFRRSRNSSTHTRSIDALRRAYKVSF